MNYNESNYDIRNNELFGYYGVEEDIILPSTIYRIREKAFRGNKTLKSIVISNSVTQIDWGAFSFCENLGTVTIPASVNIISISAFEGCKKLQHIIIEENRHYYSVGNIIYSKENTEEIISTDIL
ncbi:leucine-rich repeat domain-containing protein [Ruminococcus sp.]|uniref:leucine-rich repeat domain-containing protein n=1 Tax=Ruminococcus sp. TaxID=41978 RepID=UPI0025873C75|nr:leucine-rich repeat domain-containing protein [Ruminococcus sp.]MCR5021099.1 leucine-rich repeat domain-containing protein [Ruminococcus sp.]